MRSLLERRTLHATWTDAMEEALRFAVLEGRRYCVLKTDGGLWHTFGAESRLGGERPDGDG